MHDVVDDGREDDADIGDEHHPAEQGIKRRKKLTVLAFDLHHRSHAAQDHGRIVQGIDPGNVIGVMIAENTSKQADAQDKGRNQQVADLVAVVGGPGLLGLLDHLLPFHAGRTVSDI